MSIQQYDLFEVNRFQRGQTVEMNYLSLQSGISRFHGRGIVKDCFSGKYDIEWIESPGFSVYTESSKIWEGWLQAHD